MSENNVSSLKRRAGIASIILCMLSMGSYLTLTIFVPSIAEGTGASVGSVSLLFTVFSITTLLISLVYGQLTEKFSIKFLTTVAAISLFIFWAVLSFATNIWLVYLGSVFLGISVAFCRSRNGASFDYTVV